MTTTIIQEITFEAAHLLPQVPEGHKCRRLHGHSYKCELHVTGPLAKTTGWVQDYDDLKTAFLPIFEQIDHRFLNDVPGLENPTSELIAAWIWQRLKPILPKLSAIVIHETCDSRCVYIGDYTSSE